MLVAIHAALAALVLALDKVTIERGREQVVSPLLYHAAIEYQKWYKYRQNENYSNYDVSKNKSNTRTILITIFP